jgi:type III secretory pathway component EscV
MWYCLGVLVLGFVLVAIVTIVELVTLTKKEGKRG